MVLNKKNRTHVYFFAFIIGLFNSFAHAQDPEKTPDVNQMNEGVSRMGMVFAGSLARMAHEVCGITSEQVSQYKKQIRDKYTTILNHEPKEFEELWAGGWKDAESITDLAKNNDAETNKENCQNTLDSMKEVSSY